MVRVDPCVDEADALPASVETRILQIADLGHPERPLGPRGHFPRGEGPNRDDGSDDDSGEEHGANRAVPPHPALLRGEGGRIRRRRWQGHERCTKDWDGASRVCGSTRGGWINGLLDGRRNVLVTGTCRAQETPLVAKTTGAVSQDRDEFLRNPLEERLVRLVLGLVLI